MPFQSQRLRQKSKRLFLVLLLSALINLFHATDLFWYSLKTVFREYQKNEGTWTGLNSYLLKENSFDWKSIGWKISCNETTLSRTAWENISYATSSRIWQRIYCEHVTNGSQKHCTTKNKKEYLNRMKFWYDRAKGKYNF